ncbi:hypothetical protein [Sphaerospermopsis sp. FACHB-1194]|uniref:hypothetical protein n=1 Tax=Sphaerospermopsis sp. FACHB-1194 TaxID=2692862 RepID=UPI0016817F90|nr:hypothetical protein [Sphaerospermopsis sp. FACHB-1194]
MVLAIGYQPNASPLLKPKFYRKGEAFRQNINGFSDRLSAECFAPTKTKILS